MKSYSIRRGIICSLGGTQHRATVNHSKMNEGTGIDTFTDCYHLKYVVQGCECYLVNERKWTVYPGEYLLVNPEQKYEWDINSPTVAEGLCFRFTIDYLHTVAQSLVVEESKLLDAPFDNQRPWMEMHQGIHSSTVGSLGSLLHSINERIQRQSFLLNEEASWELASCLLEAQQEVKARMCRLPAKNVHTQKEIFERLCKAKSIIHDRLFENFAIAELAREVHMAESHFYRSFKAAFGLSPHQYHICERVRRTAYMLTASDRSVAEIAFSAGFDEPSTFTRIFKKVYGIPPSGFRNQQGKV